MGHDTLTQPLLPNEARLSSREIVTRTDGKMLQCGGKECPWMTKDTAQRSQDMKKLSRAVAFCVTFMILEVVGGIRAGSLAILTDAAHLLSDVASFAISLFAMWAGGWEANLRQTYGFFRLEILGALVSIQIIWLITGIIVYEAFVRLVRDPVEIDGRLMFIIASLGLIVNLIMMFMLGHDHGHSHGHDHGHSHGSNHKHSQEHKHSQDHHDHNADSPDQQHNHTEEHNHHHHGQEEHDHDHHDHEEPLSDNHHHGEKGSRRHSEDLQGRDHADNGRQDRHDEVHDESNESHASTGLGQDAAVVLRERGHKTECVEENITKSRRSKSGDTIIMCVCDQLENRSENDSSVRVTIDGGHNDEHGESSHGSSINVRGAYLHVLGDLIQSIGVMIGGAVIWYKPEWKIVDLLCTFFFSIIVLGTTIKMIRDILEVLMESTPREVDAGALQDGLMKIEGVIAVHELHIWAITVGKVVLACHVMIQPDADSDDLLEKVIQYCDRQFKISHVTIQIERLKQ